jgi:uncharacterized protein YhaN
MGAARQVSDVPSFVVVEKMTLADMKDEFALLMKKRAAIGEQCRESLARINAAHNMQTRNPQTNTETGRAYREAMLAVERALDAHPSIVALQQEYDAVQTQKVVVSAQKGEVLTAWRKSNQARKTEFKAKVAEAKENAAKAKAEVLRRAGITGDPKAVEAEEKRLTDAVVREVEAITLQLTKELAALTVAYDEKKLDDDAKVEREKDGSREKYAGLEAQYKAIEERQEAIKRRQNELRSSLRRSDSGIAALQQQAVSTSHAHVTAMDAMPDVAAARRFIEDADAMRANIDTRARVLRKAILEKDPACWETLGAQAAVAGLAQVGEDFWRIEG